ncbi:sensor histidine kinase [Microbacterium terricola]|uniref:histidine kinase n=1 Tax=Microbacterium terricola TaxID=344163 RepID=A0ABM8DVT1_9MICO|nr:HAMP domain-containing sensor histidine kinase [Microbacterium terricola]UYK39504.1 HAMP domain-containing histidine kinase [Microbacterium terricola]BDV29763.1 two-component sensor histidine kinase [Microbacterium terricola]
MAVERVTEASPRADQPMRRAGDARTRSIWQWQLILAVSVITILVTVTLLTPEYFTRPQFIVGAILLVLISCATLAVPWHLFDSRIVVIVPALDILAIGLMASGNEGRMALLWVFPIAWLATYYSLPWLLGGLGGVGVVLVIDALLAGLSPTYTLRIMVVLLSLGFLGVTINTGSRRTRAFSGLLRRQYSQLGRTLARAELQERRAAVLFNSVDTALARVDRRGVLLGANEAYRRLYAIDRLGYARPTGAVEYNTHRGTALPAHDTTIARATRGEVFENVRVWLFDTGGTWHALDVSTRIVPATLGESESTLLTLRDVTAALDAEVEKKTMTSIVSHEMRNPLTAIVGHVDLLLDREDLPADVLDKLAVIENAGQRMQRLITTALESDKPASVPHRTVDLRRVAAASVDAFRPSAHAAQVALTDDADERLLVEGDAFRLRQVLDNLVGNAVKYTPRGGHVEVTGRRVGDDVELAITDSGIGMSAEDLGHLFEPYFRSQTAQDSGIPGTGLGLVIAHDILTQHGGSLEITSTLGRGTTATLRLAARAEGISA